MKNVGLQDTLTFETLTPGEVVGASFLITERRTRCILGLDLLDGVSQIVTANTNGTLYFSVLDLKYAYSQLKLTAETAKQCNFNIIGGQATGTYRFFTGFYRLADMPAEFQKAMDRTLIHAKITFFSLMIYSLYLKGVNKNMKN